jgi:hypothetical protein
VKPPNFPETIKGMFQDNFQSSPFSCFFFCSLFLFCSFPLRCVAGRVCERWSVIFLQKEGAAAKKGEFYGLASLFFTHFFFFNRTRRGKVFPFLLGLLNVEEENREQILQKNSERMEECQKKGNGSSLF